MKRLNEMNECRQVRRNYLLKQSKFCFAKSIFTHAKVSHRFVGATVHPTGARFHVIAKEGQCTVFVERSLTYYIVAKNNSPFLCHIL